jgi:hypothetical protein
VSVMRRVAVAGLVVAVAFMFAVTSAAPASAKSDLPPSRIGDLAKLFRADVKPLGLKVTRGMLQNLETYQPDPDGTHLALYVEPRHAQYTSADYVRNFTKLVHKFLPRVFDRWSGLQSFDICQEPVGDTREAPPPVTQIFVMRQALDRVDNWRTATLAELLAAAPADRRHGSEYFVYFAPAIRTDPTFAKAAAEAGWSGPSSPFSR